MVSGVARGQDGHDEQDGQDVHDEHDGQDGCRLRLCWLRFRWLSCTQLRAVLFVVFVLSATPKSFCYFRDLRLQVRKSAFFFFSQAVLDCFLRKKAW